MCLFWHFLWQNCLTFSDNHSLFEEEEHVRSPLLKVWCIFGPFLLCFVIPKQNMFVSFLLHGKIVSILCLQSPRSIAPASIVPPVCTEYPADWSLKTRLLFTSPLSLSWVEQPKAQEQALGLSQHCRAQFSTMPQSLQVAVSL